MSESPPENTPGNEPVVGRLAFRRLSMLDLADSAREDPDDLIELGLRVAFQARLVDSFRPYPRPETSEMKGQKTLISPILVPWVFEDGRPVPWPVPKAESG